MKAKWVGLGVGVTLLLVLVILAVGWVVWQRSMWGYGMFGGRIGMMGNVRNTAVCPDNNTYGWGRRGGMGWGMMGSTTTDGVCAYPGFAVGGNTLDITSAEAAVQDYIDAYDDNLELDEILEFELNFYAGVIEKDTGTGAMELLVDKRTGRVSPEMGPNMMWNTKYAMYGRGGMMTPRSGSAEYSEQEMLVIAQDWLDSHQNGRQAEDHGDMYYGYMTVEVLDDGQVAGMLSVNDSTGEVWYHSWHGDFVGMAGDSE